MHLLECASLSNGPDNIYQFGLSIHNITNKLIKEIRCTTEFEFDTIKSIQPKFAYSHWMNEDMFVIFKEDSIMNEFSMMTKIKCSEILKFSLGKENITLDLVKKQKYWHVRVWDNIAIAEQAIENMVTHR